MIGGAAAGAGNTIAFNGFGVVRYEPGQWPAFRVQQTLPSEEPDRGQFHLPGNPVARDRSLQAVGGGAAAMTPNDPLDSDTGSNDFQNFPVLTAAYSSATTRVQGSLSSTPNRTFVLDFYATSAAHYSGDGEGGPVGSATVTTDANGNAQPFDVVLAAASSGGEFITATATDAAGNTSNSPSPSERRQTPHQQPTLAARTRSFAAEHHHARCLGKLRSESECRHVDLPVGS